MLNNWLLPNIWMRDCHILSNFSSICLINTAGLKMSSGVYRQGEPLETFSSKSPLYTKEGKYTPYPSREGAWAVTHHVALACLST